MPMVQTSPSAHWVETEASILYRCITRWRTIRSRNMGGRGHFPDHTMKSDPIPLRSFELWWHIRILSGSLKISNIWAPGGDPDFTGEMWKSLLALVSHEVASQDSSILTTDGFSNPSVYVQCICGCVCLLPHKILTGTRDKTRGRLWRTEVIQRCKRKPMFLISRAQPVMPRNHQIHFCSSTATNLQRKWSRHSEVTVQASILDGV